MSNSADKIISVMLEAGRVLKECFESRHSFNSPSSSERYSKKSNHELVLEEDLISDEILVTGLSEIFPKCQVYSEERKNWELFQSDEGYKFLIDPLDGTHNYYYGLPQWGVSVSLINPENVPEAGYIYIPSIDLFVVNSGAPNEKTSLIFRNQKSTARTAQREDLSQCMFAYDNQFYRLGPKAMKIYNKIAEKSFTTRISGSAAYDTAMVASGRYDARIWNKVHPYDVMAGIPIVLGAGGYVSNFRGERRFTWDQGEVVICSNEILGQKLISAINEVGDL